MKLVKSLLLGSAAGLAAVAGAQAADLPVRAVAPVEYVRVCSTYGAGFFYIPGTETCLRVGGRVRAEVGYLEPVSRFDDAIGFRTRGRIQVDARTATAYGLLRTFVRFEINRQSGTFYGATGAAVTSPNVAQAFVQFGGLTAGRVTSFFSNADLPTGHFGTLRFDDAPDVNTFAYTFAFGNGFSATLGVEDALERRNAGFVAGGIASSALIYGGQRTPNVVGNVKYAGTWGSLQLSGVAGQVRAANVVTPFGVAFPEVPDSEFGWAVGLQGSVNLPALAPGDALWFAATYADGALNYLGFGSRATAGALSLGVADAFINTITGDVDTGRGWSVAGGLRHYWAPQIRQNVFGSYARIEYAAAAQTLTPAGFRTGLVDFNEWRLGTNVIWQPVSGLDIGVEVLYTNLDPRGRVVFPTGETFGSEDVWEGRLRVQRDF